MQKKHSVSRGIIAILPLGLAFSLLLLLALPAQVGVDAGAPAEFKASLKDAQVIGHKLDISKYSELPKARPEISPSHTSEAKKLQKESGFFASNEKLALCSKDGKCESQFNLENLAGEINDFKVYFTLGFSEAPREATLWQSTFFGHEAKKKADGSEEEVDYYRWIPVDESHFSFKEGAKRAFLLRYNVTPCTNGTWNASFYSPFGVTSVKGRYASICPAKETVNAARAKKEVTPVGEAHGRLIEGNSDTDTFYGTSSDYWNGSEYSPINLSIVELPEDNPLYSSDYRTGVEKGAYKAYFKPDASSAWPVLAEKGGKKLGMKPFAIAYKDPSWGGLSYIQISSSSIGIPNENSVTYPTVFTGTDIRYDYESGRFKETITLTDEFRSLVAGLGLPQDTPIYFLSEVDIDGLTPTANGVALPNGEETLSKIDFLDSSGSKAYSFLPSLALDSSKALIDGREIPYPDTKAMPAGIFQGNGRTFYATSVPLSWLMRSVYPIEIDPTTQFTDTYCLIHLYGYQNAGSWPIEIQIKWDISNLASGETIQNSTLCLHPNTFPALLDYRANVSHITNQSWTTTWSLTGSQYQAMVYDNVTTAYSFYDAPGGYMCINVTNITKAAYGAGEKNLTIRINHPDYYPVVGAAYKNSLDIGSILDPDYERGFDVCGLANGPYLEITHNLNLTPTVVETRITPTSPITSDTLKLNVTCNDPDNPTLNLSYLWNLRNLFDGNWTCASWSSCSPSNSFCTNCTNGWYGISEDRYTASDPGSGWIVSQNSSDGVPSPDFHARTDNTGQGSLWAYRAFKLPLSSGTYNISWWWRGYHTSQALNVTAYIWAGNVTPCHNLSQTTNCGAGNTTNSLSNKTNYIPATTWNAWSATNASFMNQNIANSMFTIGFLLDDASNAQALFYEFDNLTISPYFQGNNTISSNVSMNPSNISSGNLSWYDTWGANFTCSDSTYNVSSYAEVSLTPSICGNLTSNTTLNSNVNSNDTCFTILANDITLDCNGFSITYGTGPNNARYGVNNTGYNRTTVQNCVLIDGNTSTSSKHGVFFTNANNNSVINNTITTYGSGSEGVYVASTSPNNNITSNRISTNGTSSIGVYLASGGVNNTAISFNNITTNSSSSDGLYLWIGVSNSLVYSNSITTTGSSAYGIHLKQIIYDNRFWNNTITTAAASLYFDGSTGYIRNNSFENSTITNGSALNLVSYNAYNIIFLNMTFNKSQVTLDATSNLTLQWYVRVNVTGPSGSPVQNALVNISDIYGKQVIANNLTGSDGLTNWATVTEMYMGPSQNFTFNNHTINVSSSSLFNTTNINITGTLTLNFSLYSGCATIYSDTTLTNSIASTTSTCMTIGADNITLDCAGYTITGTQANAYGVLASGRNNITVKNCLISNYTTAILFTGTNNSFITSNTIYNTSGVAGTGGNNGASCTNGGDGYSLYGISLTNSKNNSIASNAISNLSGGKGGTGGNGSGASSNGCNGGVGGSIYGIYLISNSLNTTFTSDTLTRLTGGNGGDGGNATGLKYGGNGSAGGLTYAIYITDSGSANNSMLLMSISQVFGGTGGNGGTTPSVNTNANGGNGGAGGGVYLRSANNIFTGSINNVTGGSGGTAGDCGDIGSGTGGAGGDSFGFNVSATNANATIENATLSYFTAGNGGDPTACSSTAGIGGTSYVVTAAGRYGVIKTSTLTNSTRGNPGSTGLAYGNGYGVYLTGASTTDYNMSNSTISQTSTSDIYLDGSSQNNTILNSTFNTSKVGFGTCSPCNLTVQWYLRVYATNVSPIQGAIVNISDAYGKQLMIDNLTGSNGYTNWAIANEMIMNKSGSVLQNFSFNNHMINVSFSQFQTKTNNVTSTKTITFTQYDCGVLTQSLYTGVDIYYNDTCFTFGADNITLDCGSKGIVGNHTLGTYAIYAPGRTNITIKDCYPINYSAGIMLSGTNRSSIRGFGCPWRNFYGAYLSDSHNNTLNTSGCQVYLNQIGAYLNSSSGNNFSDLTFFYNNYDVILESSNSNQFINEFFDYQNYSIYLNASSSNVIENSSFASTYVREITSNQTSLNNIIRGPPQYGYSGPSTFAWGSGTNNLTLQHYLRVNATYYLGGPVSGALVNITDAYGKQIMVQSVTNSSGLTNFTLINITYMNSTNNFTFNNYTINVSKAGAFNSSSLNVTSSQTYNASLYLSECLQVSVNTTLLSNLASNGTCVTFSADNVALDCAGHRITGNDSADAGYGIYAEGRKNITIKNCIVSDYQRSVYFNSTNSSLLSNNTLNSSGSGLTIESSSLNNVFNNSFIGNVDNLEFASSSNWNTINTSSFASATSYDAVNTDVSTDDIIFNCTSFNRNNILLLSGNLSFAWPVRINFTDKFGDQLGAGGSFQINETNGRTIYSGSSTPNPTAYYSITEETQNSVQSFNYNNHTFYASWADGSSNLTVYNITGMTQVNLTIPTTDCKSVYHNTTLSSDVTAQTGSTCFTMAADNIFLDCSGHTITGTTSLNAYAVYMSGRSNITIKNCIITQFINSIWAQNSQNLSFLNNTIHDCGYGSSSIYSNAIGINLISCSLVNITNHTDWNIVTSVPTGQFADKGGFAYGIYANTVDSLLISNYSGRNHSGTLVTTIVNPAGNDHESRHYTLSEAIGESIGAISSNALEQDIRHYGAYLDETSVFLGSGRRAYLQGGDTYVYRGYGLYFTYVSNSSVSKVSLKNMSNGYGIHTVYPCAANLSFQNIDVNVSNIGFRINCPVNITGLSVDDYNGTGIYLESLSSGTNVTNFNITRGNGTTSALYALQSDLDPPPENNTFQNGKIQNATYGLRFSSTNWNLLQNISINSTSYGIYSLNSRSNRLYNITSDRAIYGIYMQNSNNTNFTDSIIHHSSVTTDVIRSMTNSVNNIFLNTTANYSNVSWAGTDDFLVQWFMRVNVTSSSGTALQNALVNISDINGMPAMVVNLTNSNGLTGFVVVNDTNYSSSGNFALNNQTINATLTGYLINTTSANITSTSTTNLTLYQMPGTICSQVSANTTLVSDVTSSGTCFNITAHNVFLDCNGHIVTYDTGSVNGRYGVNNTGYDNVTIKNCIFSEGNVSTSSSYAIAIQTGADNNTVENNTIYTYGSSSYGIYASIGGFHNIYSNKVVTNGTTASAIYLTRTNSSSVYSNNLTANSSGGGIFAVTVIYNNSLYSNNINASGGGTGITFSTTGSNNSAYLNTILSSSGYGAYVYRNMYNTSVYSNTITTTGGSAFGMYLARSVTDTALTNNTITTAATSVYLDANFGAVTRAIFANSTITNGSATNFYAVGPDFGLPSVYDNIFLNMTFNISNVVIGTTDINNLTIQWYARVNVTNSAGSPLQNAIVNISDILGFSNMTDNLTNPGGLTNYVIVTEMVMNGSTNVSYTNHTINASLANYAINSTSMNITSSSTVNLTLYAGDNLPPSVTITAPSANQNVSGPTLINATVTDANPDASKVYYWLSNTTGNVTPWIQMSNTTATSFNATFITTALSDGYYNVTINATDLYSNTNATEYVTIRIDNTAPVVTFVPLTPANNTNLSQSWVYVNVTTNEETVSAIVDWNGTYYAMTQGSSTNWYRNMTGLSNGSYAYRVYVNDSVNNTGSTGTMNVTIDTSAPAITFVTPTPPNDSNLSQNWAYINITSNEPIISAVINWNGTFYSLTQSSSTNWFRNMTVLGNGTYTYNVSANDTINNTGISETRNLTIDTVSPVITFVTPTPPNNSNLSQNWAYVNITTSEYAVSVLINWNGTWYQFSQLNPTSWYRNMTSLSEGTYDYYVQANDSANNTGTSSTQNLTIDTTQPALTLVSPTHNNESVNYAWSYVNLSSNENLANATLNWNGTDYPMGGSGINWYLNRTGLGDGNYSFFANASDFASNTNTTETRWVLIDTIGPIITFVSMTPGPDSTTSRDWVFVNVTTNERVDNASVYWNGTSYYLLNSSPTNWYFNITGLANGTYVYNVSANDTLGNNGTSLTQNVTVDTSAPMLTFVFPTNNDEFINYNWSYVNMTSDKALDNATLNWNGTDYSMQNTSSIEWYLNMSNLADGNYSFQARGNDSLNNLGYSETRWVLVDTVNPIPTFVYPTPSDNANLSTNWAYINVSANERIISALLDWNGTFYSMSQLNSTVWYRNMTSLGDGICSYTAHVNDSANNSGNIGPRTVRIDTITPTVSFVPPTPSNNSNQVSNSVFLNVSISEAAISCLVQNSSGFYAMSQLNSTVWYATMAPLSYSTNHSFTVYCNDTVNNTGSSGPLWVTVDIAPSVSNTQICANDTCSPVPISRGSSLNCSANVTDDFNSSIDVYFKWFVNGSYSSGYDSIRYAVPNATFAYAASPIPAAAVNKSDTWGCEARPYDGLQFGSALNSSTVTVNNTAPSIGAPSINNTSPINTSTISCDNGTFSDADGDQPGMGYWRWFWNGSVLGGQTSQSLSLLAIGAQATDQIICEHMSEDSGYDPKNSTRQNSTTVTLTTSSAPIPNNATLCKGTACLPIGSAIYLNDSLNCSANITDAENSTILQVNFTFYRNSTAYSVVSLDNVPNASISYPNSFPPGALRKSDTWICEVSAYDGEYSSNRINGSVAATVNNTAPWVTAPSINDTSPYTDSVLLCNNGSFSDADNDSEGSRVWGWFLNGTVIPGQISQTLDLSQAGAGNRGDTINCSQDSSDTGWDSKYSLENISTSVTIINTPPSTAVSISPSPAAQGSDVTCSALATDADGDSINFTYIWWNGVTQVATTFTNSTTFLLAGANTTNGETWTCQVTPFDGFANGTATNASVNIQAAPAGCPPNCPHPTPSLSASISGNCVNQTSTITISSDSGPVPGVSIKILRQGVLWQIVETGFTDAAGRYVFTPNETGQYEVQASLFGYNPTTARFTIGYCGTCGICDGTCPGPSCYGSDPDCDPLGLAIGGNACPGGGLCCGGSCKSVCTSQKDCSDGDTCTIDSCSGSNCSAICAHAPITSCLSKDGCCPAGCTSLNDSDCSPTCSPTCKGDVPGKSCQQYACVLGDCIESLKPDCCGNSICEPSAGESNTNCPTDCLLSCGNGFCDAQENKCNCPSDCGSCSGKCAGDCTQFKCTPDGCSCTTIPNCCGNGACEKPENFFTCSTDCPPEFLSLRIYSPSFGQDFLRGDRMHLAVKVFAEFVPAANAIVSASGFFGKVILYDDGMHGDGAPGDGLYGAYVDISSWVPYGPQAISFDARVGDSNGKRSSVILITNNLALNMVLDTPTLELGDTVFISGNVSGGSDDTEHEVLLDLSAYDSDISKQSKRTKGDFDFAYRTSFLDSAGNWIATITVIDDDNNTRMVSKLIAVEEPVPEKFLSVEYLSPVPGAYLKGQDVPITIKVTDAGNPITGAQAKAYGPKHKAFPLEEVGDGVYSSTYKISLDDPSGIWELQSRVYKTENGVLHGGAASTVVAITDVPIKLVITEPAKQDYSIGETLPINVLASYSEEKPADNIVLLVRLKDRSITARQVERGVYGSSLELDPGLQGANTMIIFARDPYENYGIAQVPLKVQGYSPWYYIKLYWIPIIAILLVALSVSAYYLQLVRKREKLRKLLEQKQEIVEKQRRVQSDYFVERSMDRGSFDQLSQKYDEELRKVEREMERLK